MVLRVCWIIPSESTLSRAFSDFADIDLGDLNHAHLVESFLSEEIIGHVNRDSTAIKGREEITQKPNKPKIIKGKRGRPKKGSARLFLKKTRLQVQLGQTPEQSIADLPDFCDLGLPLSTVLTSASVHDSQVAIPLIQLTSNKVQYCCDFMDAAYDSAAIEMVSKQNGYVPIIDPNKRRKKLKAQLLPHEKERYKERGAVERFFGRLKDEFGAKHVMVKGTKKVKLHLMFGVIAIFADQLTKINAS